MDKDFLWYALGAAFLHYLIFAYIIHEATSNKKKNKHLEAQTELLVKIARAQGVAEDELNGVITELNNK